ncbi:hypothetical protein LZ32DRAFT_604451 [Colletotrichum eremochloae]|nr:hypothetical protein LZ32DRAFT_604451 [Colletotrichum eremochloae]
MCSGIPSASKANLIAIVYLLVHDSHVPGQARGPSSQSPNPITTPLIAYTPRRDGRACRTHIVVDVAVNPPGSCLSLTAQALQMTVRPSKVKALDSTR